MYRRPRRKPYLGWLAAIAVIAVVAAGVYGLVRLIIGTPNLDRSAVSLPASDDGGVFAFSDGLLFVSKTTLTCTDLTGKPQWSTSLPTTGMKAARVGKLTVAWGGKYVLVIDETGVIKQSRETSGDTVLATVGLTNYAVVTKEENQHRLWIYAVRDNKQVDEELFPYESVLGLGFFGDGLSQLWTLVVDSHGTEPMTKLTTYYPGKATTGEINLSNEVGYAALLEDKMTYIVGTHTLTTWEHTSDQQSSTLVYGWNLEDKLVDGNGRITFLFSPTGSNGSGQISSLWYIDSTGGGYRIPLPAGCFKAMLKAGGGICVATANGVYTMDKNGANSRFYPLAGGIDSIAAVVSGKAIVYQSEHRNYLVNMP